MRPIVQWLFAQQSTLSPDAVFRAAVSVGGVSDPKSRYTLVLNSVRQDIETAHRLGVTGTSTFFINGVMLPALPPVDFEAGIRHELEAVKRRQSKAAT